MSALEEAKKILDKGRRSHGRWIKLLIVVGVIFLILVGIALVGIWLIKKLGIKDTSRLDLYLPRVNIRDFYFPRRR